MRVFLGGFCAVALLFVASCGDPKVVTGPEPPTTPPTTDGIPIVTIKSERLEDGSEGALALDQIVDELKTRCGKTGKTVRLDLRQGDVHLRPVFTCRDVRRDLRGIENRLVASVADRHNARERSEETVALQEEIQMRWRYDPRLLTWSIGTGTHGARCSRSADQESHRRLFGQAQDETPEEWIQIEAVGYFWECPEQLPTFFAAAAEAIDADAAETVERELRDASAQLKNR